MSGKRIPGVPRIAQFIEGQSSMLTPFVGSLWAALEGMGRPWPYADILALSGAGNRLAWRPGEWHGGNCDILACEEPPFAPHQRAFRAVGLHGEVRMVKSIAGIEGPFANEAQAREEIMASIDAGIPVIAMGIIGPPECCVVFGYEDGGDSLVGWSYFQADEGFPAEQPFVKGNWYAGLVGYILPTPAEMPPERDSALAAYRAIVDHAYHADVRGAKVGLAAWEAMLCDLEHADFDDCMQVMLPGPGEMWEDWAWSRTSQGRFFIYCDALCQVHERSAALQFHERMASAYPEWAQPLNEAIDAWRACSEYGGFLWKYLAMNEAGYVKFADPAIRKVLADEGRRAMELDRQAVEAVRTLLAQ